MASPVAQPQGSGLADDSLPRIIKAEVNLLRLPLFALSTKNLRNLDGIECRGFHRSGDQVHEFTFRSTRNTSTLYPGPLSRRVHLALLSIATENGVPIPNPIRWSYRDVCRRMGVSYGKRQRELIQQAVIATALVGIQSSHAIFSKKKNKRIKNAKAVLRIYDRVLFYGEEVPKGWDGGVFTEGDSVDANYVWLCDWYLDNLNALYTAPLDYQLWRWLENQSSIASRLYEFLLVNMYSGSPKLKINYSRLAPFLPVRCEHHYSDAKKQLDRAIKLITNAHVVSKVQWTKPKTDIAQLHFYRGPRLAKPADQDQSTFPFMEEEFTADMEVKELRNTKSPAWSLVSDFYQLWAPDVGHRPTRTELKKAEGYIAEHGFTKAKAALTLAITAMKQQFPNAKTFGAVEKYLPEAVGKYDAEQRERQRSKKRKQQEQKEAKELAKHDAELEAFRAKWNEAWERLPSEEQGRITQTMLAGQSQFKRQLLLKPKAADILRHECVVALAAEHGETPPRHPAS